MEKSAGPVVAYLTAGGAGMFCGSCMRDNALVAALADLDCEPLLIPLYTPVRTDEANVTIDRVFFGGVNVYLQQRSRLFRWLPRALDGWLAAPWLLRRVAGRSVNVDARALGELTLSMVRGEDGLQRKEIARLVDWLREEVQPDLVVLSNVLIAGCVPALKRELGVPVLATLQGDDIFWESLPATHRGPVLQEIRSLCRQVDGFITFSNYYADFMAEQLGVPRDKFHLTPLGLSPPPPAVEAAVEDGRAPRVGYFARIAPAKGFDRAVDAWLALRRRPEAPPAQLWAGGWLGESDRPFFNQQVDRIKAAGLGADFHYVGSPERDGKFDFLRRIDVFSVPTAYREPKGIYVLEALSVGVPVVQPDHGAFSEMVPASGGGLLVPPGDAEALADAWIKLLTDAPLRTRLSEAGRRWVLETMTPRKTAEATLAVFRKFLHPSAARGEGVIHEEAVRQ